jgi:hypothetical protein
MLVDAHVLLAKIMPWNGDQILGRSCAYDEPCTVGYACTWSCCVHTVAYHPCRRVMRSCKMACVCSFVMCALTIMCTPVLASLDVCWRTISSLISIMIMILILRTNEVTVITYMLYPRIPGTGWKAGNGVASMRIDAKFRSIRICEISLSKNQNHFRIRTL